MRPWSSIGGLSADFLSLNSFIGSERASDSLLSALLRPLFLSLSLSLSFSFRSHLATLALFISYDRSLAQDREGQEAREDEATHTAGPGRHGYRNHDLAFSPGPHGSGEGVPVISLAICILN